MTSSTFACVYMSPCAGDWLPGVGLSMIVAYNYACLHGVCSAIG